MKCPRCKYENPEGTVFCGKCGMPLKGARLDAASKTETLRIPLRELIVGSSFAGRYQVLEDLGTGGMGHVYKVMDKEIGEFVALKILRTEISGDEKIVERFHNELKLARRISHKNVCGLYHLSRDEYGTYYITMEYVPGEDLRSLIRRVGSLTVSKAVRVAEQICEGLAEAHRLGVVHRDLKPQNIMIDDRGHVRIMDFGIARSLASEGVTGGHIAIGTPEFMSPEQAEGKDVDGRTDIYALGVILYEMLTGRVPFEGNTALAVAMKHKTEIPKPPKRFNAYIPESLNRAILRCLEKKKEKRYQSAAELYEVLASVDKALRPTAGKQARERKPGKTAPALRVKFWPATVILAVVILLGGAWILGRKLLWTPQEFENYISLELTGSGSPDVRRDLIEYVLLRALTASTRWNILIHEDVLTYKKKTQSAAAPFRPAMLVISGDILPKAAGFDLLVSVTVRTKTSRKTFDCKGFFDFFSEKIGDIHAFLSSQSGGIIGAIEGNRTVAQISTSNLDALDHFLKGEEAWNKLDSETAFFEYRTALENDPGFSLARLRLADALIFRSDRDEARRHLELALAQKDRLIEVDLLRLKALVARLDAKPSEEREYLGKLTEAFPFKKEFHYEFAESYFHCGDAEEAIKHYEKALEIDANYSLAHNHLAYCYSWIGDHEQALEHFQKYFKLDDTPNACDSLATGYTFAGDLDHALEILEQGIRIGPNLDYLYGNMARNLILLGSLKKAREAILRQAEVTTREYIKMNAGFWLAFIEFLRDDRAACLRQLAPALTYYDQSQFRDRLDEAPNLPFWLDGLIAAQSGDLKRLRIELVRMEQKIQRNQVSATNFFPIFKFYIHLKVLEGRAVGEPDVVLKNTEEGKRIRHKMGYWGSLFNIPYFFNQYADALLEVKLPDEAETLLNEAKAYNDRYPWTHLELAKVFVSRGDLEKARVECEQAAGLLSRSDADCLMARDLAKLRKRLIRP
jgi:tetratricopeptide (TPR) repeat protein